MSVEFKTAPVEDSVAKVNNEIAVGEDLQFQRIWWRVKNRAWLVFAFIVVLDLAGLFGRGPLASAERGSSDGTIEVKYERIERTETPSILTVRFGPQAINRGEIRLYVSQNVVKGLGTQRIIPAPAATIAGHGGLTYTFLVTRPPATVDFALRPPGPGIHEVTIGVVGASPVRAKVLVVP